ncbi:DNA cytosine methyltransferase [Azospirillaceae bacterium]
MYSGIGGNRRLWGNDHDITAIELNPQIAKIYQDFFPNDKVIVTDAHQYLLEHFKEYDFIWSSRPCVTHSRINIIMMGTQNPYKYPDMGLYEEIIFLKQFAKSKWVVENVIPYYEPLIKPQIVSRHCFWANFFISDIQLENKPIIRKISSNSVIYGFDIRKYKVSKRKDTILRNMVSPELGLHILSESKRNIQPELFV